MEDENESDDDDDVVFAKAKEFLSIVRAQFHIGSQESSDIQVKNVNVVKKAMPIPNQFGVPKLKKLRTVNSTNASVITPSQRKKLERIKVPVISFKKASIQMECPEEENKESVQKMLEHIKRLPQQDIYLPPQLPMVAIDREQEHDEDTLLLSKNSSDIIQTSEFHYLTREQDLTTWELLRSSPTNCNVFIGNLSYKIDRTILLAAFQPFVVKQHQHNIKVRIVTDSLSGGSKGYGFVQFPYRRAAELAMICMQGFQIFDREIQLGWGQEEPTSQTGKIDKTMDPKKLGIVIFDSYEHYGLTPNQMEPKTNRKRRWDVEACSNDHLHKPIETSSQQTEKESTEKSSSNVLGKVLSPFSHSKNRPPLKWLTKEQRVQMIKVVCENLRKIGVKHHIGVFGIYFEADNSRLFVVCCKTLTSQELKSEFEKFGAMELVISKDALGLSKGSVIVQYEISVSAERAMKKLHGKILGSKPLAIKLAEPKRITH